MNSTQVGSITLFNLTHKRLMAYVNSNDEAHVLPAMESRSVVLVESIPSPIPANAQVTCGLYPIGRTFLRATSAKAGYFHQGLNRVRVQDEQGANIRTYDFELGDGVNQTVEGSAAVMVSDDAFLITGPEGKTWPCKQTRAEQFEALP